MLSVNIDIVQAKARARTNAGQQASSQNAVNMTTLSSSLRADVGTYTALHEPRYKHRVEHRGKQLGAWQMGFKRHYTKWYSNSASQEPSATAGVLGHLYCTRVGKHHYSICYAQVGMLAFNLSKTTQPESSDMPSTSRLSAAAKLQGSPKRRNKRTKH